MKLGKFFDLFDIFKLNKMKQNIKNSFNKVKVELDEHLDAINQNTNEIQNLYEIVTDIENKIESLAERLEHVELSLSSSLDGTALSSDEKRIFYLIYILSETKKTISISDLVEKTNYDPFVIEALINSMIAKGVPISKYVVNNTLYYEIEQQFKELQTKKNILKLNNKEIEL